MTQKFNADLEKPPICPYSGKTCNHYDSLSLTLDIECENCEYYGNGVIATGDSFLLGQIQKLLNKIFHIK